MNLVWGNLFRPASEQPFYNILVQPGDRTVRRGSDQIINAQLVRLPESDVRLFARYGSASKWEEAGMQPEPNGNGFQFMIAGIPESADYYVEADGIKSSPHKLTVIDLPAVKHLRVTYRYPAWTGMKDKTEDPGGDLRAVEGTSAEIAIQTDRPMPNGILVLDDDSQIALHQRDDGWMVGQVPIQKDGEYHVASAESNEKVRISEDFFIEAQKVSPPNVRIVHPMRDARVNPIEEVPVQVQADDDFGLRDMQLHYSVNAGPEKIVSLLPQKGAKQADGSTVIYLEDFKLAPGDMVTMYASASDARSTSSTDMTFVEAQPFELEYSQAQSAGGGMGGGGEEQNRISERQKEIIAATWNQIRSALPIRRPPARRLSFSPACNPNSGSRQPR